MPSLPHLSGHFHHPGELGPLFVGREVVAVVRAGEAALRRQAQRFQRHVRRGLVDLFFQVVLALELRRLGRHQPQYNGFVFGNEAQRLEAARALGIEFHEERIDAGREHRLRHRLIAALGDPGALEVAAAGMHGDRHARGLVLHRFADRGGVAGRQRGGVVAVLAARLADLRIAEIREGDVVELQVRATRLGELGNGRSIGARGVGPELVHVVVGDAVASGAQVEHRRRWNGELRGAAGEAFEEAEVVHHDRLRITQLPRHRRDRRLLLRAAELRARVLAQRDAFELRKKVEVPPLPAEFAVSDALQADGFLPGDDLANGVGGDASRAQQAADMVGTEGWIQSAFAPDSFTACVHFVTSWRRKAANSPAVFAFHSRPSCASFAWTSGEESALPISLLIWFTRSCGVPAGAKNPIHVRSSKPEKPCSFTVGTSGSAGERRALVTANARTRPALTCDTAGGSEVLPTCACPATTAPTAAAGEYGTCVMSMPAAILMRSTERCVVVPMPEDA